MKMKLNKQKLKAVVKSFSFRVLVFLLIVALIPLITFGFFSMHYVKTTLDENAIKTSEAISEHFIDVYKKNIVSEAQQIDLELKKIEENVSLIRTFAKELYTNKEKYEYYEPVILYQEKEGYYWDRITDKHMSNVGVSGHYPITGMTLDNLARSKYLEPLFQQSLEQNKHISAIYFIMPDASWRIYPALNLVKEIEDQYFNPNIPVTNYPFYLAALTHGTPSNQVVWTNPYTDVTHRETMFSATTAIYNGNELIGVIGADITIETVIKKILNTKFKSEEAYSFLVSQNGSLIAVQEHGKQHFQSNRIADFFKYGIPPEPNLFLEDETILLTSRIPTTGWYLGYIIQKNSLVSPIHDTTKVIIDHIANQILSHFTATSLLLIALCIYLSLFLWSTITKPIRDLIVGISSLKKGKKSVQIKNTEITEFQKLITAFNTMSSQIDFLLQQLQNRIHEKELLHEELKKLNLQLEQKVQERTEELKQANAELVKTNEQLRQIQQSRAKLISNLSHDLKTPLTIISGYVEAFLDGMIDKEQQPIYLQKIMHKITTLSRLAKDLYDLSLFESNKMPLKKETTTIGKLSQHLSMRWEQNEDPVHRYAINFANDIDLNKHGHLTIELDLDYLNRAIENIVENAYKYGDDTPIDLKISLENGQFIVQITNQGSGISEEHLPHIFKRTYRADKSRNSKTAGHGLGLAIVKEIVEAHGGSVTAESEVGKWTTFTISLPLNGQ